RRVVPVQSGVDIRQGGAGRVCCRRPAEVLAQMCGKRGASAGVLRVEQKVLHVHRQGFLRVGELVWVRAAQALMVRRFSVAPGADPLRPARQIQPSWIVAQGMAPPDLPPAFGRQSYIALNLLALVAGADQPPLRIAPGSLLIIEMGQLMDQ